MVELRCLHMDDLPMFLEIRNECADALHDNRRFRLFDALQWWKRNWGTDSYARSGTLQYKSIDEPGVGMVGYARIQKDLAKRTVTVGIDIHKDHRRKGYAQAAYEHLFHHYLADARYNRMQLEVLATNTPAIALYEKLGFSREGVRRQAVPRDDGFIDSVMMSILHKEWEAAND